jgi:hypothetical protein
MKITVKESSEQIFNFTLNDIKKCDGIYQARWRDDSYQEVCYVLVINSTPYTCCNAETFGFNQNTIFSNPNYRFRKLDNAEVTLKF